MPHKSNLITANGLKWLDLLEKKFDKAFVDLDLLIGGFDDEQNELVYECRQKMTALSAAFAQLSHKCSVVFENNSRLEKDLNSLRKEVIILKSENKFTEVQLKDKVNEIKSLNQAYHSKRKPENRFLSFINHQRPKQNEHYESIYYREEIKHLRKENLNLRKYIFNLQSELFGTRLAAKYLDKELSGRIQQIQLLGIITIFFLNAEFAFILGKSDLKGQDQDRVWNQLEAEIHLHRHKTVIKACRGRNSIMPGQTPDFPPGHEWNQLKKRQGIGDLREVTIERNQDEALGISITGGREHGIPPLISELHKNTPASRCGALYVGDAIISVNGIDLRSLKHADIAKILSSQKGTCVLQVVFVAPDEESDEEDNSKFEFELLEEDVPEQDDSTEALDIDALSTVTETLSPSHKNKFYPGFAKLCLDDTDINNLCDKSVDRAQNINSNHLEQDNHINRENTMNPSKKITLIE